MEPLMSMTAYFAALAAIGVFWVVASGIAVVLDERRNRK